MKKSENVNIDGIGQVLFERSKRAKYLNISVKPRRLVRVAVPYGLSFKEAEELVCSKIDWIQKHLDKMKRLEEKHKIISKNSDEIDKAEASQKLVTRLNQLSEQHGFTYNNVSVRNQKTIWGSCSGKNNISLNIKLTLLPAELIDYVILHELLHTRIRNHSKSFWSELDKFVGNAKAKDSRLSEYKIGLL
ncbi:DUF45 domain-containing protein [Desulfococcaceae bacterium HSG8]|nr:DUF45 domain-containing protein [Desulfococcaceae bacterium HSG8]